MKSRDLIKQLVREDMPDLEQVRENCHRQPMPQGQRFQKLRWSAVAVAACLMLATVAYAASVIIDRFDTGGSIRFISVPYDSPQLREQQENTIISLPIYLNSRANVLPRFTHAWVSDGERFSPEDAQIINEMLEGKIFTADGEPFVLITAMHNQDLYHANAAGNILFDRDGYEIGAVRILTTWDGEMLQAYIATLAEFEAMFSYSNTFQEGVELLGQYFRLPTVHIEGFAPPLFRLDYWENYETGEVFRWVTVRYTKDDVFLLRDLILIVETERSELSEPLSVFYITAEITEIEIAGITVTKMLYAGYTDSVSFFWIYDGLVYRFLPPSGEFAFSAGEVAEIIESMLVK